MTIEFKSGFTTVREAAEYLHGVLHLALEDLRFMEASENFEVNMGLWCDNEDPNDPCYVCLAGTVFARALNYNVPRAEFLVTDDMLDEMPGVDRSHAKQTFYALDYLRCGKVGEALSHVYTHGGCGYLSDILIELYGVDATAWWSDMQQVEAKLAELAEVPSRPLPGPASLLPAVIERKGVEA